MSDKASTPRAKQACEPCRRKKTKCPGERPVCSFCQRLGQRCSYEKGDDNISRVQKPQRADSHDSHGSRDRLQRLESRVEEVFDLLSNFTNHSAGQAASSPMTAIRSTRRADSSSHPSAHASPITDTGQRSPRFDVAKHTEPPHDLWPTLLDIYRKKFDYQPLPVLGPLTLQIPPNKWPKHLRHSFLSLTIPFATSHGFISGSRDAAVAFYTRSARQEIMRHIANGEVSAETLQASSLSALREIAGSNSVGAWMSIGVAIRLALSTGVMSNKYGARVVLDSDTRSRCCWSLFALDRVYGSTLTVPPTLATEDVLPEYPTSAPSPIPPTAVTVQMPPIEDLGVLPYYLQLLSIWGTAMGYVQSVKDGEPEDAWSLTSKYNKVVTRLSEFETKFAQVHRYQQARFHEREIEVLENQRSYWAPWLTGQFLFHTIQGLINHPFLHIASRPRRDTFQPPSFMQNSIDQAVLHCSWIVKFVEVCGENGFKIYDPFVGHLAAITATIYLFLLNAKDSDLSSQARLGFERCYNFIQSSGDNWPHLRHTVDKLDILQRAAITNSDMPANRSAPKAQRSLLWELLDYSASTTPSRVPEFSSDAVELNVDTRFLSPTNPLSTGDTPATIVHQNNAPPQQFEPDPQAQEDIWDPSMSSFDFNLFDNEQMADLTNLTFGRNLWSFGQL